MCKEEKTAWQTGYNDIVYGPHEYYLPGCNCPDCKREYEKGRDAGNRHLTQESDKESHRQNSI